MEENKGLLPTEEHIEMLMNNPERAFQFDKVYGEGSSNKFLKVTEVEQPQEAKTKKGIVSNIIPGVQSGTKETLESIQGVSNWLQDNLIPDAMNFTIRSDEDGIRIVPKSKIDEEKIARGEDPDKTEGGLFQDIADAIPEPAPAEGLSGGMTRGITQFVTGFIGGGKVLNALGWTKKVNKGFNVGRTFVQGGIADFAVFDEHEARLSDLVVDFAPEATTPFFEYMSADENDTFMEGKFKNVLEGVFLGGVVELIFKSARMVRGTRKRLDSGDMKGAKEFAEKEAKDLDDEVQKFNDTELDTAEKIRADMKKATTLEELDAIDIRIKNLGNQSSKPETIKSLDEAAEEASATQKNRGIPPKPVKGQKKKQLEFNQKNLNESDYFKNVRNVIKKIRDGEMKVEDLADINYNLNFLKNVDDAATTIKILAGEVHKVTKEFDEVRSHGQVWKDVDDLAKDPREALQKAINLAKDTEKADAYILSTRLIISGLTKQYQRNLNLFKLGKVTQKEVDESLKILRDTVRLDKQLGSNTGRALNIRNVLVGSTTKAEKSILKLLDEAEVRPEEIDNVKNIKDFHEKAANIKNKRGVIETIKKVGSGSKEIQEGLGINKINKWFINALLSNPKTHMINMTSNLIMAVIRPMELYVGGVIKGDKSSRIEAIETTIGLFKYYQDSLQVARRAFQQADSVLDKGNFKVDIPEGLIGKDFSELGVAGKIEKGVEIPTRLLSAEDEFFKQINFRSKVYAQSVAEGLRKGLSRKRVFQTTDGRKYSELDKFVEDNFATAFERNGEATKKFKVALEYAQENTFTKGLGQGTVGKGVQSFVNTVPILRQIMPFVRTPVNIMRAVQDRTPLGFARKQFRDEYFSNDPTIAAGARGKLAMGTALMASGLLLANNGTITGAVPKNKHLRRQKMDTGWKPYSLHIGDKYYSFERLDPFAMFLGLMVDYTDIALEVTEDERNQLAEATILATMKQMDIKDYADIGVGGLISTAQNLTNKTYIKSLTDFVSAMSSGDINEMERYGKDKLSSYIPNIIKGVSNDPTYREARTLMDTLKTRTWAYGNVDPSYNVMGEVRSKGQSFWDSFLIPTGVSEDRNDEVMDELVRLDASFAPVSNVQGNVDLLNYTKKDKNAWVRWNELVGETSMREDLLQLINSDKYKNQLTDTPVSDDMKYNGSREAAIREVINKHKKRAKKQLLKEGFISNGLDLKLGINNDDKNKKNAEKGRKLLPIY